MNKKIKIIQNLKEAIELDFAIDKWLSIEENAKELFDTVDDQFFMQGFRIELDGYIINLMRDWVDINDSNQT